MSDTKVIEISSQGLRLYGSHCSIRHSEFIANRSSFVYLKLRDGPPLEKGPRVARPAVAVCWYHTDSTDGPIRGPICSPQRRYSTSGLDEAEDIFLRTGGSLGGSRLQCSVDLRKNGQCWAILALDSSETERMTVSDREIPFAVGIAGGGFMHRASKTNNAVI